MTEADAIYLRDMMIENTTLKGLNLSHNEFTDKGGVLLAQGIGMCITSLRAQIVFG